MRHRTPSPPFLPSLLVLATFTAPPAAFASPPDAPAAKLRGVIDRVEGDRLLLGGAWVIAVPGTRFGGPAAGSSALEAGMWAEAKGDWDDSGALEARKIRTRPEAPGRNHREEVLKGAAEDRRALEGGDALYRDEAVEKYVAWLGAQLVPEWARERFNVRFLPLADPEPGAFSLADGTVFVTTGLLAAMENDAQLAAILGHEIAHVTQYHATRAFGREARARGIATAVEWLFEAGDGGTAGDFIASIAVIAASESLAAVAIAGYARDLEDEADRVGLRYAVEAGFDPRPAPEVWPRFGTGRAGRVGNRLYFYGHPKTGRERQASQRSAIARHYSRPETLAAVRPADPTAYLAAVAPAIRDTGMLLRHAGRNAEAREALSRFLTLRPDDAVAHRELGRSLAALGRPAEARAELEAYLRTAPADAPDRAAVEAEIQAAVPQS